MKIRPWLKKTPFYIGPYLRIRKKPNKYFKDNKELEGGKGFIVIQKEEQEKAIELKKRNKEQR